VLKIRHEIDSIEYDSTPSFPHSTPSFPHSTPSFPSVRTYSPSYSKFIVYTCVLVLSVGRTVLHGGNTCSVLSLSNFN
jgi:hypothetical protein